jgi:hypothetical protein
MIVCSLMIRTIVPFAKHLMAKLFVEGPSQNKANNPNAAS